MLHDKENALWPVPNQMYVEVILWRQWRQEKRRRPASPVCKVDKTGLYLVYKI